MAHANAALTPKHRLRLARLIVDDGWPPSRAAEFFHVSWRTADKWARRYRAEGVAGMVDRSSARHTQPARTSEPLKRKIVHLRWKQRLGPVPIAAKLAMPASTVHAVLVRCRLNRLTHIDRVIGEPARRYERERPGELIHVDVTKFGNIPDGGGWRFVGVEQGSRNRNATRDRTGVKSRGYYPKVGTCFVHTVIDDYSRIAYAEIHDDEKAVTAAGVLHRAVAWFAGRGVTVERVLSDNGPAYISRLWRDSCTDLQIKHKRTRPRRPQTNGKIERFHRTLADGWAYKKLYRSEHARRSALAGWLHQYNHHRPHSALGGLPPVSRLDNLAGHHS
ncbi:IS481 family transposase [Jiangella sp. DSM 45060]|uniref:IS481 family transposase n=1 Tax=Jiangella sp. DSM 45060 TaxID=1798224 RepID=UPI00087DDCB1|nr:IS481 family transposase [Jiangella sp. DSM 45060]SDT41970.1 leucine-zipper of insertion element IS481 [Jiangella sp. DSM 45060]